MLVDVEQGLAPAAWPPIQNSFDGPFTDPFTIRDSMVTNSGDAR